MLNHITIMGRLTRDPELRYTQSQTPVASFTLAVDRDRAPEGQERETDFIDCVAWRQTGEFVDKYFAKGSMAVVAGRLQIRDWNDRDGNKRRSAEVVVENIYFGESKQKDSSTRTAEQRGYRQPAQRPVEVVPDHNRNYGRQTSMSGKSYGGYSAFAELEDDDGDLPF